MEDKDVPTTSRNPTVSAVCEGMYKSVGNILQTILHINPPQNVKKENELIDYALATVQHAMKSSVCTILGYSP